MNEDYEEILTLDEALRLLRHQHAMLELLLNEKLPHVSGLFYPTNKDILIFGKAAEAKNE